MLLPIAGCHFYVARSTRTPVGPAEHKNLSPEFRIGHGTFQRRWIAVRPMAYETGLIRADCLSRYNNNDLERLPESGVVELVHEPEAQPAGFL